METKDAIVVDGAIRLIEPLNLPNNTRVRVTLQIDEPAQTKDNRWEDFLHQCKNHPIHSGQTKVTRDELN